MLKILRNLGLSIYQDDKFNWTPLTRAYSNHAYDTARYLMLEEGQNVSSDLALKVKSTSFRRIKITQNYIKGKINLF